MKAVFVQEGNSIDYTPGADVAAGDVVVQGDLVGVAKLDISAGSLGALAVAGVFSFPKATGAGTAIGGGVNVYWNATAEVVETVGSSNNIHAGEACPDGAGDDDATVDVRLGGAGRSGLPVNAVEISSAHTVSAAEHGALFIATAAVAFTLPTKRNGLAYRFVQSANETMQIIGSGDIIAAGSPVTSMIEFSTSNQKIASQLLVECVYVAGGSLKWIATNLGGTTATLY